MSVAVWLWAVFALIVVTMLVLDLGVFHREARDVSTREALTWVLVWVGLALLFNVLVYYLRGGVRAAEFFTGYLLEYSLSVDNIFVFLLIFTYFVVPAGFRHRVLFWGILGAVVMRGIFIALGTVLISRFHWVLYVFGAFLVITGIKFIFQREARIEPERNPVLRLFRRYFPITPGYHGQHFFVREGGPWLATPLFVVLLVVETTDLAFAVDSIPAIFGITTDAFIVYTSNVFAILGLRSLYFLLAGVMEMFRYLRPGLGLVLAFVGVKMLIVEFYRIPVGVSLLVIGAILAITVAASLWVTRDERKRSRAVADTHLSRTN